jgi:glycosyltransferase involved in cell wall biosynthesis
MHVLIAHPGAELYGADRVMLESAAGLVDAGHQVTVVLPEPGPLDTQLQGLGIHVIVRSTFVLRKELLRPRNWGRMLSSGISGLRSTWRLIAEERPDVAYVSTVVLPQWPAVLRLRGVPVITHVHEAESASPWPMRAVLYAPQLCANAVIANSRFTAELMAATFSRLRRRTRVIHNPIPAPTVVTPPRRQLDVIHIGYVGRLSPRKGPDVIIDAVALLRARGQDARLEIVGDVFRGYEWYAQQLDDRIRELSLSDAVARHGYASDVWPHIAAADVMIVPSRTDESFGNTAVEAVLGQRAVVVSDLRGLREAVEAYSTSRIVPPDDPEALADVVLELATGWPRIAKLLPPAASAAAIRHSISTYRASLAQTVEQTARRRRRSGHRGTATHRGQ